MPEKIIQFNEGVIKDELKELVRNSVEETLNGLLDQEAAQLRERPNMNGLKAGKGTEAEATRGNWGRAPGKWN
jgi:hypothetical protein